MKRTLLQSILLGAMMLLTANVKANSTDLSTMDNVIYVEPQTVEVGTQATLSFRMKNTTVIRDFQFDLYLPEGVTAVKNSKGRFIVSLNSGRLLEDDEHTLTLSEEGDGAIRFLCGSQFEEDIFTGNEGEVVTMKVSIAETMTNGDYPIVLRNMRLCEPDINKYYDVDYVESTLKVTGGEEPEGGTATLPVKMTYVDYNNPDTPMGELDVIQAGCNKVPSVGSTIPFYNIGWGVNKVGILKADVSSIPGTAQKVTLKAKVSGSVDSKRATCWGLALTDNTWSAGLTYTTVSEWTVSAMLDGGKLIWTETKSAEVFEEISFDITEAFTSGQASATIFVYETAAGGGYMKEAVVEVEYEPYEASATTFTFEDSNNPFTDASRITSAIEDDATLGSNVLGWTCAYNSQNGYSFSYYDFTSLLENPAWVKLEFDYYNTMNGRSLLTIGDALVRGTTGGSSRTTYNKTGAVFRIGSDKSNAYINDIVFEQDVLCDKWLHVVVTVTPDARTVAWIVTDQGGNEISSGSDDFYADDANACTQIDVFGYYNNSHCAMMDNLTITNYKSNAAFADYTVRYVDPNGNEIKESRMGNGQVGKFTKLMESDKEPVYTDDGKKFIYESDDSETVAIAAEGTVITVTFREAEKYYAVLNCKAGSETLMQFRDDDYWFWEGETYTLYPARYYKASDGSYWGTPATDWNGASFTFPGSISPVVNVGKTYYIGTLYYEKDETVAYYANFEDLALPVVDAGEGTGLGQLVGTVNNWWSFANGYFSRFSGARGIRLDAGSYVWTEPIAEDGTYMVRIYGRNDKSANCEEPYALGYRDAEGNVMLFDVAIPDWGSATTGESVIGAAAAEATEEHEAVVASGIGIKAGWSLVVMNTGNGDMISLDDIKLTKVADYAETPSLNIYAATFYNAAKWENVYAYAWSGEGEDVKEFLGTWPGTELKATDGIYIVFFTAAAAPDFIIFNNGLDGDAKEQTPDLVFEDGKAYTYNIDGSATDIVISPEGGDIAAALEEAKAKVANIGNITVNLAKDGDYTIGATLTAPNDFILIGNDATITVAEEMTDNFITLNGTETFAMKDAETPSDHYLIKNVELHDVTIKGLQGTLVRDAQKTLVENIVINNANIEMPAAPKDVFDFNGKGYAGKVTVTNSTIWAKDKNTGFFARYGSRPKNINGDWLQEFDIENSTIVNIANGKNMCDLKQNGTAQNVYTLKNNIFVDCGKQNQVVVGFNKAQASATPVWDVTGNYFEWGGACVNADEITRAGQKDDEDIVKNCIDGKLTFTDAANGDFNGKFELAEGAEAPAALGAPMWTLNFAEKEDDPLVYTEFVEETGTLTYYYNGKMNYRTGVTEPYDPINYPDAVRFKDYYKKVTKVAIDPSMKAAPLTSFRNMSYGGFDSETFTSYNLPNVTSIEGLENLNTEIVTDMNSMFTMYSSLTSIDVSSFNTSNVTNMNGMFLGCNKLQTLDLTSFDVSNVKDMRMMFGSCYELTTIYCEQDWSQIVPPNNELESMDNMYVMFGGCKKLVGGMGTAFDSNVTDGTYARPDGGTDAPGYFTVFAPVTAPEDLVTAPYYFKGFETYYEEDGTSEVQVGFYGENQVYIQGLSDYVLEAWVVGTIQDNVVTIPKTYLGITPYGNRKVFFSGATFVYDAEAETFTSAEGYVSYETPTDEYWMEAYKDVVLTKIYDVATTPADPEITNLVYLDYDYPYVSFHIPTVSAIDGKPLMSSKLYYTLYYYKNDVIMPLVLTTDLYTRLSEDMSVIPYVFSDDWDIYPSVIYLNQPVEEIDSWQKIGIQSVYYGGGSRRVSNIVWYNNETADGIASPLGETEEGAAIYNVAGQRMNKMQKGINIVGGKKIFVK